MDGDYLSVSSISMITGMEQKKPDVDNERYEALKADLATISRVGRRTPTDSGAAAKVVIGLHSQRNEAWAQIGILQKQLEAKASELKRMQEAWERDNLCGVCPYRQAVQAENERLQGLATRHWHALEAARAALLIALDYMETGSQLASDASTKAAIRAALAAGQAGEESS